MSKETPKDWKPINPKDCPNELDRRNIIRFEKMERRIIDHIDEKFKDVAPSWQMAINEKTHNLVQDVAIFGIILTLLLIISSFVW